MIVKKNSPQSNFFTLAPQLMLLTIIRYEENKRLGQANILKDQIKKEFNLSANEREMKNFLADWFHYGDMPKDRVGALEVLIKVFKENGNKSLAQDLEKIRDSPKQVN